ASTGVPVETCSRTRVPGMGERISGPASESASERYSARRTSRVTPSTWHSQLSPVLRITQVDDPTVTVVPAISTRTRTGSDPLASVRGDAGSVGSNGALVRGAEPAGPNGAL